MLANVFAKRVVTLATQEGSAYGAALLALVGTGVYTSVPEICKAVIREVESISPQPDAAQVYAAGHPIYKSLYPALQAFYTRTSDIERENEIRP
jgi:xylulokinase